MLHRVKAPVDESFANHYGAMIANKSGAAGEQVEVNVDNVGTNNNTRTGGNTEDPLDTGGLLEVGVPTSPLCKNITTLFMFWCFRYVRLEYKCYKTAYKFARKPGTRISKAILQKKKDLGFHCS